MTVMLLMGVSSAWAAEWTHVFVSPEKIGTDNSITVNEVTWNVSTVKGQGSPTISAGNSNKQYGLKFGSSATNYYSSVILKTSNFANKKVTKVVCNILNNGSKSGFLQAKQGDIIINTTSQTFGQTWTDLTVDGEAEHGKIGEGGDLEITYQVAQAFSLHSITVTYENMSNETFTVTFNPGTNGTCATESLTEASAGAGVTLPVCTANEGYVFKGWAEEGGNIVGQAGDTYKPGSNCTLNAVYNALYTLTITQPTDGGTLSVTDGTNALETGARVEAGTNLTCEVSYIPEGKRFSRFYAKYGESKDGQIYKATNPATFENIPTDISALEVYVNYMELKKYTINYMVNGVNVNAQENVYEGTALVFPSVNDLGGKQFVGWSETEIDGTTNDKPSFVQTDGLTASENKTYYAVFATIHGGDNQTYTDNLTIETTGVVSGSQTYTSWSNKKVTSDAIYSGTSAGDKNSIQIRSKSSDSGVFSTATGGLLKKVAVEWNDGTSTGRVLNVYGKATAYETAADLYDNEKQGTLIGTIVKGTSTELVVNDEYAFVGVRSNDGAIYLTKLSFDWEKGTPDEYSAYCTTVPPYTLNISPVGWASMYLDYAVEIPEGVSVYYAKEATTSTITLSPVEGYIPANCGVVVKGSGNVTFKETAETVDPIVGNLFHGDVKPVIVYASTTYVLSSESTPDAPVFGTFTGTEIPANKAYLEKPVNGNNTVDFTFDDATAIDEVASEVKSNSVRINLAGQIVGRDYKGIVIVNGKKMFNK